MILVAGSTGFLGREICRRLSVRGHPVRALVRSTSDPEAVAQLRDFGAETVVGDVRDPRTLDAACGGAEVVVSTVTATRSRQPGDSIEASDQQGQLNLVDAARAAGAARFVLVSLSGQIGMDAPISRAKRTVEARVRESGMAHAILRPGMFMEVWLSPALGFDPLNARATIYGSGESPISWISLSDVAEFAVRSAVSPVAENGALELGGPEALSPNEVVRIFEEVGARPIEVQRVPEEALRAQYAAATDSLQQTFAALMLAYAGGDVIPMEAVLRRYPMRLRTVREYAGGVLAAAPVPPHAV